MLDRPIRALFWLAVFGIADAIYAQIVRPPDGMTPIYWLHLLAWLGSVVWVAALTKGSARGLAIAAAALMMFATGLRQLDLLHVPETYLWLYDGFSPRSVARGLLLASLVVALRPHANRLVPLVALAFALLMSPGLFELFRRSEVWKISEALWQLSGWLVKHPAPFHFAGFVLIAVSFAALRHAAGPRPATQELADAGLGLELFVAGGLLTVITNAVFRFAARDVVVTLWLNPLEDVAPSLFVVGAVTGVAMVLGFILLARANQLGTLPSATAGGIWAAASVICELLAFVYPYSTKFFIAAVATRMLAVIFLGNTLRDGAKALSNDALAERALTARNAIMGGSVAAIALAFAAPDLLLFVAAAVAIAVLVLLRSARELSVRIGRPPVAA